MPATFVNGPRPSLGYESITVSTTSVSPITTTIQSTLTNGLREQAVEAVVTIETNPIRYRVDGTAPTSSEGHLLNAGDVLTVQGFQNITNLKMIRQGSADATVRITYFK